MQIQQLRYFVTLIEKQSFTATAHEFFISQAAISQQIKALEKELEVDLIARKGRTFEVTPAGRLLFHRVQGILSELDTLTQEVQRVNRNQGASLRLGLLSSMDKDLMPEKLRELVRDYLGFELHIIYGSHEELYELFSNGTLNAFVSDSSRLQASESFSKKALFATRFLVELPRNIEVPHRGKTRLKLNLSELIARDYKLYIVCEREHLDEEQRYLRELFSCAETTFLPTSSISEGRKFVIQQPNTALIYDRSLMKGDQSTHSKLKCYTLQNHNKTLKRDLCCYARKNIGLPEIQELCAILKSLGGKKQATPLNSLELLNTSSTPLPNHNTATGPNYSQGPLIY